MKILFQGDSITDAGRSRDSDICLGFGYAHLVSASLGFAEPGKHEFFNRGISGNRVVDLYSRIKIDMINLCPDVMSILIGVNDVWHEADFKNGVDADKFYRIYCMLIEEVKEALPDIKIIILEPFVLNTGAPANNWEFFSTETAKRAEMAKKVAEKYGLPFVPLQKGFEELCKKAPAEHWLGDGVHPTAQGHEFIKNEWLKAYAAL